MMNDNKLNLNIIDKTENNCKNKVRVIQLQVRVKAIIEGLIESIKPLYLARQVFKFLKELMKVGKVLPNKYLSVMEKAEVRIDIQGRLM